MSKRVVGLSLFLLIAFGVITFFLLSKDALQTGICPGGLTPYDCPGIESPVCGVLCDDDRMPFNCTTLKCECDEGVNYELPCPENPFDVCLQNADCYYGTRRNCKEDLGHASDCSVCENDSYTLFVDGDGVYFCMPDCVDNEDLYKQAKGDGKVTVSGKEYEFDYLSPSKRSADFKGEDIGGTCTCPTSTSTGDALAEITSESCTGLSWCATPLRAGQEWVCEDTGEGLKVPNAIRCKVESGYEECSSTFSCCRGACNDQGECCGAEGATGGQCCNINETPVNINGTSKCALKCGDESKEHLICAQGDTCTSREVTYEIKEAGKAAGVDIRVIRTDPDLSDPATMQPSSVTPKDLGDGLTSCSVLASQDVVSSEECENLCRDNNLCAHASLEGATCTLYGPICDLSINSESCPEQCWDKIQPIFAYPQGVCDEDGKCDSYKLYECVNLNEINSCRLSTKSSEIPTSSSMDLWWKPGYYGLWNLAYEQGQDGDDAYSPLKTLLDDTINNKVDSSVDQRVLEIETRIDNCSLSDDGMVPGDKCCSDEDSSHCISKDTEEVYGIDEGQGIYCVEADPDSVSRIWVGSHISGGANCDVNGKDCFEQAPGNSSYIRWDNDTSQCWAIYNGGSSTREYACTAEDILSTSSCLACQGEEKIVGDKIKCLSGLDSNDLEYCDKCENMEANDVARCPDLTNEEIKANVGLASNPGKDNSTPELQYVDGNKYILQYNKPERWECNLDSSAGSKTILGSTDDLDVFEYIQDTTNGYIKISLSSNEDLTEDGAKELCNNEANCIGIIEASQDIWEAIQSSTENSKQESYKRKDLKDVYKNINDLTNLKDISCKVIFDPDKGDEDEDGCNDGCEKGLYCMKDGSIKTWYTGMEEVSCEENNANASCYIYSETIERQDSEQERLEAIYTAFNNLAAKCSVHLCVPPRTAGDTTISATNDNCEIDKDEPQMRHDLPYLKGFGPGSQCEEVSFGTQQSLELEMAKLRDFYESSQAGCPARTLDAEIANIYSSSLAGNTVDGYYDIPQECTNDKNNNCLERFWCQPKVGVNTPGGATLGESPHTWEYNIVEKRPIDVTTDALECVDKNCEDTPCELVKYCNYLAQCTQIPLGKFPTYSWSDLQKNPNDWVKLEGASGTSVEVDCHQQCYTSPDDTYPEFLGIIDGKIPRKSWEITKKYLKEEGKMIDSCTSCVAHCEFTEYLNQNLQGSSSTFTLSSFTADTYDDDSGCCTKYKIKDDVKNPEGWEQFFGYYGDYVYTRKVTTHSPGFPSFNNYYPDDHGTHSLRWGNKAHRQGERTVVTAGKTCTENSKCKKGEGICQDDSGCEGSLQCWINNGNGLPSPPGTIYGDAGYNEGDNICFDPRDLFVGTGVCSEDGEIVCLADSDCEGDSSCKKYTTPGCYLTLYKEADNSAGGSTTSSRFYTVPESPGNDEYRSFWWDQDEIPDLDQGEPGMGDNVTSFRLGWKNLSPADLTCWTIGGSSGGYAIEEQSGQNWSEISYFFGGVGKDKLHTQEAESLTIGSRVCGFGIAYGTTIIGNDLVCEGCGPFFIPSVILSKPLTQDVNGSEGQEIYISNSESSNGCKDGFSLGCEEVAGGTGYAFGSGLDTHQCCLFDGSNLGEDGDILRNPFGGSAPEFNKYKVSLNYPGSTYQDYMGTTLHTENLVSISEGGECVSNCDPEGQSQCASGFTCKTRSSFEEIPGCNPAEFGGLKGQNYCIKDEYA